MKRRKTAAGLLAASLLVGVAPVVTNAEPVRIVSTSITEQSSSGYRVNVTFSADAGVSRVMMPTTVLKICCPDAFCDSDRRRITEEV